VLGDRRLASRQGPAISRRENLGLGCGTHVRIAWLAASPANRFWKALWRPVDSGGLFARPMPPGFCCRLFCISSL